MQTDLDEDLRKEVRQLFGAVMCRCVELEHHTIWVSDLFRDHGIRCAVLKGGATAHLDYPDPSWREFSDIDILINPLDREKATALIETAGWVQGYPLPAGHTQFTHAITFVKDGMELDLHQRIAHRALGRLLPTTDLLARAVPFRIAGAELFALEQVDRFVHAAVHAVASGPRAQRLSGLADILVMAEANAHLAEGALERAEQQRVRSLVERGLRDAYATADLDVHDAWASAMARPITRRDSLVDRAYLRPGRQPAWEEIAHLRQLPNWTDRVRYVCGFFVHEQHGPAARARYAWSKVRRKR